MNVRIKLITNLVLKKKSDSDFELKVLYEVKDSLQVEFIKFDSNVN